MNIRRRTFVKAVAAAAAAAHLASPLVRAASPNGKLNHADIGVGGMGWNDFNNFLAHPKVNIAAICDVDANHLKRAAEKAPDARPSQRRWWTTPWGMTWRLILLDW